MSLPKNKIKRLIIERLQENLVVGHVCKQLSVARSTFYRWQTEDEEFKRAVKDAQELGRAMLCDAATSKIINIMNNGNDSDSLKASKMILNRYDPYYRKINVGANYRVNKLKDEIEKLKKERNEETDKQTQMLRELLDHAKKFPPINNTNNEEIRQRAYRKIDNVSD